MAITITEKTLSSVEKVTFDWTLVAGTTGGTTINSYDGELLRVNCPVGTSTGYTITLSDSDGTDLLGGRGALVSSGADFGTTGGYYPISAVSGKMTLLIVASCGGAVDVGKTVVYVR